MHILLGLLLTATVFGCSRSTAPSESQAKKTESLQDAAEEAVAASAPATRDRLSEAEPKTVSGRHADAKDMGGVFRLAATPERKLEYNAHLAYQIVDLKSARAFFNQWIPRYGFLVSENASGLGAGYLTIQAKVRSSQLYQALSELDGIGTLSQEQISVIDHTENAFHQQMLAEREAVRLRRRSAASQLAGAQSRNWQAAETLLAASEDKELQTKLEQWRIQDKISWATVTINLTLPAVQQAVHVEVPRFSNAFFGLANILLWLLYYSIYLVPMGIVGYALYVFGRRGASWLRRRLDHT